MDHSFKPPISFLPSIKKRTAVILFHLLIWALIVIRAMVVFGMVTYEQVRFAVWLSALGVPLLLGLFFNSRPPELPQRVTRRIVLSLVISFGVYATLTVIGMTRL